MAMPTDGSAAPLVPCYLITKAAGLALKSRLEAGETVRGAMSWRPLRAWIDHPAHTAGQPTSVALRVANSGSLPLIWKTQTRLAFSLDQSSFYGAAFSTYEWASLDQSSELQYFSGSNLDDAALLWTLPFGFPFYGEFMNSVYISSNGLISFDTSRSRYRLGWLYPIHELAQCAH